jgi:hypothetical protein
MLRRLVRCTKLREEACLDGQSRGATLVEPSFEAIRLSILSKQVLKWSFYISLAVFRYVSQRIGRLELICSTRRIVTGFNNAA